MPDITITACTPGENAQFYDGIAGAVITAGQSVYLDTATNTIKLADADVLASSQALGIAINTAAIGQYVRVQLPIKGSKINLTGMTKGTAYFVSTTAGGICPATDLASGDFPCYLGLAESATSLALAATALGVAI